MEAAFEGWKWNEANLDSRIGGGMSQIAAQLMEATSDGATNIFRYYGANIVGIAPEEAQQASGLSTWVVTDTLGHTIPAGTVAVFKDALGNHWGFEALNDIVIAPGASEVTGVPMRSLVAAEGANGILGLAVELASPIAFVSSVTMTTQTNGGSESEEDSTYLNKLAEEFQTLSPKPILPKDFSKLLAKHTNVGRVYTLGGFNPTATVTHNGVISAASLTVTGLTEAIVKLLVPGTEVSGTGIAAGTRVATVKPSTGEITLSALPTKTETSALTFTGLVEQPGYVASWITALNGEALTEVAYEKELQEQCLTGVVFKLLTPTYTTVNVEVTVVAWPGQNTTVIKEAVEAAIRNYINPATWPGSSGQMVEWNNETIVRLVNVEAAVLRVVGTHYVSAAKLNGSEANLIMTTGVVTLPKLGTLTVNVVSG